jgi:hypothetical protein
MKTTTTNLICEEYGVTVINIEPGNTVLCDLCNRDYTNDDVTTGGFLFSGKAVCPVCAPDFMKSIKKYNEQKYIKAVADWEETFRNFVYRIRKR